VKKLNNKKLYIYIIFFILTNNLFALSSDKNQPINIEADSGSIDNIKRITIYSGNVIITQGSTRINADKVTLTYTKNNEINDIIALGKPAKFRQQQDNKKGELRAKANRMNYDANKGILKLTQAAQVWQGEDTSAGELIIYDMQKELITVGGKGRVKVVIQPRSKVKK
jgi:lipopolysaccharide export system protein LptA